MWICAVQFPQIEMNIEREIHPLCEKVSKSKHSYVPSSPGIKKRDRYTLMCPLYTASEDATIHCDMSPSPST